MRDRPVGGEKPRSDEIEITPEMIRAGRRVLVAEYAYLFPTGWGGPDDELILELLEAILAERPRR